MYACIHIDNIQHIQCTIYYYCPLPHSNIRYQKQYLLACLPYYRSRHIRNVCTCTYVRTCTCCLSTATHTQMILSEADQIEVYVQYIDLLNTYVVHAFIYTYFYYPIASKPYNLSNLTGFSFVSLFSITMWIHLNFGTDGLDRFLLKSVGLLQTTGGCLLVGTCRHVSIFMYVCMYVCMYVVTYVCMYVFMYE